jgi:hypothetical protein
MILIHQELQGGSWLASYPLPELSSSSKSIHSCYSRCGVRTGVPADDTEKETCVTLWYTEQWGEKGWGRKVNWKNRQERQGNEEVV